jgi:hypothetical protein
MTLSSGRRRFGDVRKNGLLAVRRAPIPSVRLAGWGRRHVERRIQYRRTFSHAPSLSAVQGIGALDSPTALKTSSVATRLPCTGLSAVIFRFIWLLSQGRSAQMEASVTGYSPTWISKIMWRDNDHGVEGPGDRRHDNPDVALLDEAQQERLRAVLADLRPDQGRWTGRRLPSGWPAGLFL